MFSPDFAHETHTYFFYPSQERILVMHESPLICQLLKVKPRATVADSTLITAPAGNDENTAHLSAKEDNTSKGFTLGKLG